MPDIKQQAKNKFVIYPNKKENTMHLIENMTYDSERALYNIKETLVKNCTFEGSSAKFTPKPPIYLVMTGSE